MSDPIDSILWRDAAELDSNDYNPNVVMRPELRLIELSILKAGWLHPILVNPDALIIDGHHRVQLALKSKALLKRYKRQVPTVVLDLDRPAAMLMTVRINRAKGVAASGHMSALVRELLEKHHLDPQQVATEIGGTLDEVQLLAYDGVFKAKAVKDHPYSRAWVPRETGTRSQYETG